MFKFQIAADYVRHRIKAKNRHGVHSPFVYRLIDKVIYDFNPKNDYPEWNDSQDRLGNSNIIIGSDPFKKLKRVAGKIQRKARLARLIYRLANDFSPNQVLEIGSSSGLMTSHMAKPCPQAYVINLDGRLDTAKVTFQNLNRQCIKNVEIITGDLEQVLPETIDKLHALDFVLINKGVKESVLNCFDQCLFKLNDASTVVFDGIYQSKEMKDVWKQIKKHPDVTVTIDLFWMGLVFVRKKQAKEHFKIRF